MPLPDRLQTYNFLHRHDPARCSRPTCWQRVDTHGPVRMLREEYAVADTTSPVNRMLFLDWKFTLHDNDLVKVNTMCHSRASRSPTRCSIQALVDFSLRLPGRLEGSSRAAALVLQAGHAGLPAATRSSTRPSMASALPFGVWTRTHEGCAACPKTALASLAERGIFRPRVPAGGTAPAPRRPCLVLRRAGVDPDGARAMAQDAQPECADSRRRLGTQAAA